jgi:hypothetical protein
MRYDKWCTLTGLLQIVLQARRAQDNLVRVARYKPAPRIRRVRPGSDILSRHCTEQIVLLTVR